MDLIYAARYTEVCDYAGHDWTGNGDLDLPSGIWHIDTASIPEFFKEIGNKFNRSRQYIVVSPSCDFGVCLQKYNHPAMDLYKWLQLQSTPKHGYNDLQMPARIRRNRCTETDKYSIKCWSFTEATFPEIPANVVSWFVSNCEIQDPRVVPIPFGIFGNKDKLETAQAIDEYFDVARLAGCGTTAPARDKLLYVNFQFYNTNRAELYYHFRNHFPEVTCKQQCPFDEFLEDLATHKYVLCPTGNGLDCYRTLEAIYMGAIPIIENRMGAVAPYTGVQYPIMVFDNLIQADPPRLDSLYDKYNNVDKDITQALWPYWKDKIEQCRSLL